jgi:hypothetical protein
MGAGQVHTDARTGKVKYASAHDLRRSYGNRWAKKVMPAVLQKLMRHESIETTMGYYVDLDADELAEDLYQACENGQGGTVLGTPMKSFDATAIESKDVNPCFEKGFGVAEAGIEPARAIKPTGF